MIARFPIFDQVIIGVRAEDLSQWPLERRRQLRDLIGRLTALGRLEGYDIRWRPSPGASWIDIRWPSGRDPVLSPAVPVDVAESLLDDFARALTIDERDANPTPLFACLARTLAAITMAARPFIHRLPTRLATATVTELRHDLRETFAALPERIAGVPSGHGRWPMVALGVLSLTGHDLVSHPPLTDEEIERRAAYICELLESPLLDDADWNDIAARLIPTPVQSTAATAWLDVVIDRLRQGPRVDACTALITRRHQPVVATKSSDPIDLVYAQTASDPIRFLRTRAPSARWAVTDALEIGSLLEVWIRGVLRGSRRGSQ